MKEADSEDVMGKHDLGIFSLYVQVEGAVEGVYVITQLQHVYPVVRKGNRLIKVAN